MYRILHLIVIAALMTVAGSSLQAQTSYPCGTQELNDCNCGFVGTLIADSTPCAANSGQAQLFILVDAVDAIISSDADDNTIVQTSASGTFNQVLTGDYVIYSIVYNVADAGVIFSALGVGEPIETIQNMGSLTAAGIWTGSSVFFELVAGTLATVNGPSCNCDGGGGTASAGGGICANLALDLDVTCNYAASTYVVTVTIAAQNGVGTQGYQISSTHPNGFNGVKFSSFVDGPFPSGTGYNYTVASIVDPSCSGNVDVPMVECTVTPIELLGFDGKEAGKANYLFWETASEFQNSHFNLLRSEDGLSFTQINEIASKGNTNTGHNYEFFDYDFRPGTSYYKLEQVDQNGVKKVIDELVIIERSASALSIHNVYPVPSSTVVNVDFSSASREEVEIKIFDITGKLILQSKEAASESVNVFTTDVSEFAVGTYIISLNNGTEMVTRKFVKD